MCNATNTHTHTHAYLLITLDVTIQIPQYKMIIQWKDILT